MVHVEAVRDDGDRLRLRWDVQQGALRLEGHLANTEVAVDVEPPSTTADDIWRELLEGEDLWRSWDVEKQALRTAFADTNDVERRTMAREVAFDRPSVADYGRFDPTTLTDVRLGPATVEDADRWARWRLAASVNQYATAARFDDWREKAAAAFPEFPVRLPSRAALLETLADGDLPQGTNPWHLNAAEDWRL